MSQLNRVAWLEGIFLRPQHFQQQERFLNHRLQRACEFLMPLGWGISSVEVDESKLRFGQFALSNLNAILPDGYLLELPLVDPVPDPIEVPKTSRDEVVYLCVAMDKPSGHNIAEMDSSDITRFAFHDAEIIDSTQPDLSVETIQLAKARCFLKRESQERGGFISIPLAKIKEVSDEGEIKLDAKYIPPMLNIHHNPVLSHFIEEVLGMLKQRADALALRIGKGQGTANSIADFLMLQMLNRYEPVLRHLQQNMTTHPETLYTTIIALAGELATFTTKEKRAQSFPPYQHQDLTSVFGNLLVILNQTLSVVLEQTAQALPLKMGKFGIMVSTLADKGVLDSAQFIVAISADVPTEDLRKHLPSRIKIGPVEHIRELVNNQLPGIAITGLPVAPRQVPYQAGYHYFQLEKNSIYWEKLASSGGLALHISGNYPGLNVELWAIKS
ncbi:type VI secretion system baseplate subunit TssK [Alkalimonas collagenimarina]|uniref:Type VI secretion system baseplate subunit TssK n=1 Tax=Alkalimonas collagenimarina TaxID=400390 RepID=A0ABT9H2Y9_9GAMM|nr:type VI secretion system baseplate subunit TssK [Alkalimonas collagenimarina]MDP4537675.1 type VI secretion system baseplate subunit TssK [Alkalimonas collagenimarina]